MASTLAGHPVASALLSLLHPGPGLCALAPCRLTTSESVASARVSTSSSRVCRSSTPNSESRRAPTERIQVTARQELVRAIAVVASSPNDALCSVGTDCRPLSLRHPTASPPHPRQPRTLRRPTRTRTRTPRRRTTRAQTDTSTSNTMQRSSSRSSRRTRRQRRRSPRTRMSSRQSTTRTPRATTSSTSSSPLERSCESGDLLAHHKAARPAPGVPLCIPSTSLGAALLSRAMQSKARESQEQTAHMYR